MSDQPWASDVPCGILGPTTPTAARLSIRRLRPAPQPRGRLVPHSAEPETTPLSSRPHGPPGV